MGKYTSEEVIRQYEKFGFKESDLNRDAKGEIIAYPTILIPCPEHHILFDYLKRDGELYVSNGIRIAKGKGDFYTYRVNYLWGASGGGEPYSILVGPFTLKNAQIEGLKKFIARYHFALEWSKKDSENENFKPKYAIPMYNMAKKKLEELTIGTQLSLF